MRKIDLNSFHYWILESCHLFHFNWIINSVVLINGTDVGHLLLAQMNLRLDFNIKNPNKRQIIKKNTQHIDVVQVNVKFYIEQKRDIFYSPKQFVMSRKQKKKYPYSEKKKYFVSNEKFKYVEFIARNKQKPFIKMLNATSFFSLFPSNIFFKETEENSWN